MLRVTMRYPAPLQAGDRISVTSTSSGVEQGLRPRLDVAVGVLRDGGFDVVVGSCMSGEAVSSAPAAERSRRAHRDADRPEHPGRRPPWGGELAVEVLPRLDLPAIAAAEPTWLVGASDVSTLLLPLTTSRAGRPP